MMYVTRRAFKSAGICYSPGDVIRNIAKVKHFKSKLSERKIVAVTEQNYDAMAAYFKQKFGVDIPNKLEQDTQRKGKIIRPAKVVAGKL
jgi:hypothetical protein